MTEMINLLIDFFDVVDKETNISVKDKKNNYYSVQQIISCLSGIWNSLNRNKKHKISVAFANVFMDFQLNKIEYEKLCKNIKTTQLLEIISPADNMEELHIVYDRIKKSFVLSNEVKKENSINCWHFKSTFEYGEKTSLIDILNLLQTLKIKSFSTIREFLLQNVKVEEIQLIL